MGLRIGQRQCRAPGAADHHPARRSRIFRGSSPCPRSDAAACCARGGPWDGFARRRADRTGPHETAPDRTAADGRAGSRCRGRRADRPPGCRPAGRRSRRKSRGRRRPASSCDVSGANGSERLPADFPASASGAMVVVRLQRAPGEIAIDETVVVGRGFGLGQLENLLMQRRQRAGRIGIAGIAGQREGLAAAAAEIDFLELAALGTAPASSRCRDSG